MKSGDKVCIGIVNNGSIDGALVVDLIQIVAHPNKRFDSLIQVANIGTITRSRNLIVKNYLEQSKAQWLLIVDSDERLTPATFNLLCDTAHDKERKVVSGLVFAAFGDDTQGLRAVPTIYRRLENGGFQSMDDYPLDSVIQIDASGTGCLLIHRSVLELMRKETTPNQGPDWAWFFEGAIGGIYHGEDLLFCRRLALLGVKMFAHTGAILQHKKTFWLDQRHHAAFRDMALQAPPSI